MARELYNKRTKTGDTIIQTRAMLEGEAVVIIQWLSFVGAGRRVRTEDRIQLTPAQMEAILAALQPVSL